MINKNDELVIFLEEVLGVDVDFWPKHVVWREKTTSIPSPLSTRDQKVNLSYIKRLECEFLCCYKLMLRLHHSLSPSPEDKR